MLAIILHQNVKVKFNQKINNATELEE